MKHNFMNKNNGKVASILVMYLDDDGHMQTDSYDKVEDLMEDYAAYEPAKIVFNAKIRKAVRVWAEANNVKTVRINIMGETVLRFTGIDTGECIIYIEFIVYSTDYYKDVHNKAYALTELFGEEEE